MLKIDRKCPYYDGSSSLAFYDGQRDLYIESALTSIDCILHMEQVENVPDEDIEAFARSLIEQYGPQRPVTLLALNHLFYGEKAYSKEDVSLRQTALQYSYGDWPIQPYMITSPEKRLRLFENVEQLVREPMKEYRLFDAADCEPFEGEKSLGRILVTSVDGIPAECRAQTGQLAHITTELLEKLPNEVKFLSGGSAASVNPLPIIGVLKEEMTPDWAREILAGNGRPLLASGEVAPRPLLEINLAAPFYSGSHFGAVTDDELEQYLESTAANLDCAFHIAHNPPDDPDEWDAFAKELLDTYGPERPISVMVRSYHDGSFAAPFMDNELDQYCFADKLFMPRLPHYVNGRLEAIFESMRAQVGNTGLEQSDQSQGFGQSM